MNVCVAGHGMMGDWHAGALERADAARHTLVGRREEPTAEFARSRGFARWTISFEEAVADETVDVVIIATPSESHADWAMRALAHDKHVLVEIPLAMSLVDAERVVAEAAARKLTLGVVHPLRTRLELTALQERVEATDEAIHQVGGRLFLQRRENVGATGYVRSWTDNLLWHHMAHLVDAGLWLCGAPAASVHSAMAPVDSLSGIPMDVALVVETDRSQSVVCSGSYYARENIFDLLVITDRDSYRLDVFASTLTTSAGTQHIASEEENCRRLTLDFLDAVRDGRAPLASGASVLPAMRALEAAQESWDRIHGVRSLPGRPLPSPLPTKIEPEGVRRDDRQSA